MKKLTGEGVSLTSLCRTLGVSRHAYYSYLKTNMTKVKDDQIIKNQIEQIALEFPRYGYRRITRELVRRGLKVNHKRVLRIMDENDLLCQTKKKFMVTTDSNHNLPVYPNLLKDVNGKKVTVTAINQVWVSDITYIAVAGIGPNQSSQQRFVFLAVILDLYSRKVVGWHLGEDLSSGLVILALRMAIERRKPSAGLIHHSDRGVQYASREYTDILKTNSVQISMSRKGNPYDNATCESFNKTLKADEVRLNEYENYFEAKLRIANYIENIYNRKRLHSSLDYRTPEEFENSLINNRITVPI